jgi:glycosyltransferase involved in cell wall biosynthesis
MKITKSSDIKLNVIPNPGSTLICEIGIKGSKNRIKVNIDLIIYYKSATHQNVIDVVASGTQSIYTSTKSSNHIIKLGVPEYKNRTQSFVCITTDDIRPVYVENIFVEDVLTRYNKLRQKEEYIRSRKQRIINKLERIKNGEEKPDIICEGLMFGHSGFAKAMKNVAFGLDRIGCNIRTIVLDKDNTKSINTEKVKKINQLIISREEAIASEKIFWISMNNPMGVDVHNGFYSIAYVMFETEDFPIMYAEHLKKLNEIWTPSTFCRESMIRAGLSNVFVMPLGVDTTIFDPKKVEKMKSPNTLENKFKFLTICGYSERKGISILVRAFAEEFSNNNNVALYIKGGWYDQFKARIEINEYIKDINNPPLIHLDFNIYSDEDLAKIYKMCDAFVLPTRGEGWLLPAIESLSMELPTICTRYGGQLEFMSDENSYLIDVDGTGIEPRCDWICKEYIGGKFAIPNKDHLRKLMRYVYENIEDGRNKGKIARKYVMDNFSWEISCDRMYNRLNEIVHNYCSQITDFSL